MFASCLFLEDVLEGALNIGLNKKTERFLENSQLDLKKLKHLDPDSSEEYKKRFFQIEDARVIYKDIEYSKTKLKNAFTSYFLIGFVFVLCFSLISAILLSRKIAQSYHKLTETLMEKNEKLRQLKNIDQFQEIAGKLAHEIKNPLTPIEMMVASLDNSFQKNDSKTFQNYLKETQSIVKEEICKLKEMVYHFSNFSSLPDSKLKQVNFVSFIEQFIDHYKVTWPGAEISVDYQNQQDNKTPDLLVDLDEGLFRQVLINLLNNAVQANPDTFIKIKFTLKFLKNSLQFLLINDGKSISESEREKLFNMYYTTKKGKDNMGLGLSIVQKIILQHQGDITCLALEKGAGFMISLSTGE